MLGHFPEGESVSASLVASRQAGEDFETAWRRAMDCLPARALRSEDDTLVAFGFAEASFRRAYTGEPPTPGDSAARALVEALAGLYDWSQAAGHRELVDLMEAA